VGNQHNAVLVKPPSSHMNCDRHGNRQQRSAPNAENFQDFAISTFDAALMSSWLPNARVQLLAVVSACGNLLVRAGATQTHNRDALSA
jgi:hypothetical protein